MLNLHFPHPWCVAKFFAYPLSIFCLMQIQPAFAGVISITTATESRISDSSDTIEIETVVRNDGDEPALDVALEFPQLQKGFAVTSRLEPAKEERVIVKLTRQELGVSGQGQFVVTSRITYRDQNYFPLSAVHPISLQLPPLPPRLIDFSFPDLRLPIFSVSKGKASFPVRIRSLSDTKTKLDSISVFSPLEISGSVTGVSQTLELNPKQQVDFKLEIDNHSGIEGSRYLVLIIARGSSGGLSFAETARVQVEVKRPWLNLRLVAGIAIILLALGGYLLRLRRGGVAKTD